MVGGNSLKADPIAGGARRSCRFLLGSLVALVVAFPFLEELALPLFLVLPIAAVFVAGVAAVDSGRHLHTRRAVLIAAIQVVLTILSYDMREGRTRYFIAVALGLAATAVLIVFATYCVLNYVLQARVITIDQIYAGICMYIMLGFAFGAVFFLVNILDPDSFAASTTISGRQGTPDLMYFSFVTLATLGYGDITPRTNIARSLAVVEALVGMLYIAIFMARLVSMQSINSESD